MKFLDMNECQNSNGGCNQTCTNTLGSFECSCGTGYILSTNNFDCNGKNFFQCKVDIHCHSQLFLSGL